MDTTTVAETLLWDRVREALDADDGRLVVTAPPQEALKTSMAKRALGYLLEHGQRPIYATYLEGLARSVARQLGDGSLRAVGVGSALTGFAADALILDDPLHPTAAAAAVDYAQQWLDSAAMCRLRPRASAVVFATRLGPDDLPARLIERGWPVLNFPAVADGTAPDALLRSPGEALPSLRGRSREDWQELRRVVGERTWQTQFQGVAPAAGAEAQ